MGQVDWKSDANTICNRFRAFEPWPGSWTIIGDKRLSITEMIQAGNVKSAEGIPGSFIFDKPSKAILVTAGSGVVAIRKVKPAGGKEMDAASFWNGLKDKSNLIFHYEVPVIK